MYVDQLNTFPGLSEPPALGADKAVGLVQAAGGLVQAPGRIARALKQNAQVN